MYNEERLAELRFDSALFWVTLLQPKKMRWQNVRLQLFVRALVSDALGP